MKKLWLLGFVFLIAAITVRADLGAECSQNSDCSSGSCLFCPADTQFEIYTNEDPSSTSTCKWLKEEYGDKAYCPPGSEATFVTEDGGEQGYCGRTQAMNYGTNCFGNWNGDNYSISFYFLSGEKDDVLQLTKLLTQDVLDVWKEEALKKVSEKYFETSFDIANIEGQFTDEPYNTTEMYSEIHAERFYAYINYNFKFDWAENEQSGAGSSWVRIRVAEKTNSTWRPLSKDEMMQSYREEIERWHTLGLVRPEEFEIESILSKEEALKKLKSCNRNLEIEHMRIDSVNGTLVFNAWGDVNEGDWKCIKDPHSSYTRIVGSVDLLTGELTCRSEEAACSVYKTEPSGPSTGQKSAGFFSRLLSWFGSLFS